MGDEQAHTRRLTGRDHRLRVGQVARNRLFAHHVLSGAGGGDRDGGMLGGRRTDVDNVAAIQQRFHTREGLPAILGRQGDRARGIGVVKTCQLDRQSLPTRRVIAAHIAAAGNTYSSHIAPFPACARPLDCGPAAWYRPYVHVRQGFARPIATFWSIVPAGPCRRALGPRDLWQKPCTMPKNLGKGYYSRIALNATLGTLNLPHALDPHAISPQRLLRCGTSIGISKTRAIGYGMSCSVAQPLDKNPHE